MLDRQALPQSMSFSRTLVGVLLQPQSAIGQNVQPDEDKGGGEHLNYSTRLRNGYLPRLQVLISFPLGILENDSKVMMALDRSNAISNFSLCNGSRIDCRDSGNKRNDSG